MVIINKEYYAIPRHQDIKYTQEQKQIKTNRGHHRDKILRNVEKSVSDPQVLEDTIERDKILRNVEKFVSDPQVLEDTIERDKILRNVEKSVSDPQVLEDTIERDKILRKVCL